MIKIFLSILIFWASVASAQISGILLTSKSDDVRPKGRKLSGIQTKNITIPGGEENLKKVLTPFLGQDLSADLLIDIKQKIILYYVSQNRPNIAVSMPKQYVSAKNSVLQILIIEKKFGKAIYKGETWYSEEQLNRYLSIYPGQEISEDTLQNNLSWLNRNPFNYTEMKYVPSANNNTYDVQFTSRKRRVLRFYTRGDDTGTATTGYGRFATGFSWGNALWIGDIFSFEYAFSNHFKRYQSFTATYSSLLSWKHLLNVLGTYALLEPESPSAHINAKAGQLLFHYTIPFKPIYKPLTHSIIAGLEYKYINSQVFFPASGGAQVEVIGLLPFITAPFLQALNITQLYLNYTLKNHTPINNLSLSLDFYASPVSWMANQTNADFNTLNPNSKNKYCYGSLTFAEVYTVPDRFSLSLLLRGQISNSTLPPTELFILGGYNTVRGYHEAELATDNGFIGNFELRSKPIRMSFLMKSELTFLAFVDYGLGNNWYSKNLSPLKTPPKTQWLMGVGPGLRYTYNPYIQARVDYGFKLHQLFTSNSIEQQLRLGFGQFHFGLLMSY